MWTIVPQRKRISAGISSQDDPFAKQFFGLQSALFQFVARESDVPGVFQKQAVLHITELRELFDDAAPYLIARSPIFLCNRLLGFWLEYHTPIAAAIGTVFRQKPDVTKRISHRFDLTSFFPINRSILHQIDMLQYSQPQ